MKPSRLAEVCADKIKRDIQAQPGDRWHKSGQLLRSVRAEGTAVVVTGDRLQRDETAQLFADECVNDPTREAAFDDAIDEVITAALRDEK